MSHGQLRLALGTAPWVRANRADLDANAIYRRHYSAKQKDSRQFVGPGEYVALVTPPLDALFVWRKFKDDTVPKQRGISCSVFRNESRQLSSALILAAEPFARAHWPRAKRWYTFVDPGQIRSVNPGCCFIKAGWRRCGKAKGGLIILQKHPRRVS